MSETTHLPAIETLLESHRGRLLAFLRLSMSQALARRVAPEDILQETLLEATRKLDRFELRDASSFYAWLVAIARFKLAEAERALRAHKRAREEPLELDPAQSGTSPSAGAMRAERDGRLRAALDELPSAQSEALRLRYLEGVSLAEAAARMQRSEAALKALVTRAFATLASRLAESR